MILEKTLEKIEVYAVYQENADITFIMKDVFDASGEPISTECVGWHYGEPYEKTLNYVGRLKANY